MKSTVRKTNLRNKAIAITMAFLLAFNPLSPIVSTVTSYAARLPNIGDKGVVALHTDAYCLNGCFGNSGSEIYERVDPSQLGSMEPTFFLMTLALVAGKGDAKARAALDAMKAQGLNWQVVSEDDLKYFQGANGHEREYQQSQAKHLQWAYIDGPSKIDMYLAAAGLVGGSGGGGGAAAPSELSGATSPSSPHDFGGGGTITFSGSDAEFYTTVPLEKTMDGTTWTPMAKGSEYTVSGTTLTVTNTSAKGYRFNPAGTKFASAGGGYPSADEMYRNCFEVYMCAECTGGHPSAGGGKIDLSKHQTLVNVSVNPSGGGFYVTFGGGGGGGGGGGEAGGEATLDFKTYYHPEDWTTHYNVRLTKYDDETGKKIEGSTFELYERFDSYGDVSDEDGAVLLNREPGGDFKGGYTAEPSWSDDSTFRQVSEAGTMTTDNSGHVDATVEHKYHYEKTFCDGHPAPKLMEVPEPEEDEDGNVTNQDEIDHAEEENERVKTQWRETVAECEGKAASLPGVHFHWINGTSEESGPTESADGETSYVQSGCKADCEETYDKFINMEYTYTWVEIGARTGYTIHGTHKDDIPIEAVTTNSSEGGANASFGGTYSDRMNSTTMMMAAPLKSAAPLKAAAPKKSLLSSIFGSGNPENDVEVTKEDVEIDADELIGTLFREVSDDDGHVELEQITDEEEIKKIKEDSATHENAPAEPTEDKTEEKTENITETPDTQEVNSEGVKEIPNDDIPKEEPKEEAPKEEPDKVPSIIEEAIDKIEDTVASIGNPFLLTVYAAEDEEILYDESSILPEEIEQASPDHAEYVDTEEDEVEEAPKKAKTAALMDSLDGFFGSLGDSFASLFGFGGGMILGTTYSSGDSSVFGSEYYPTESAGTPITPGDPSKYSHCNDGDNETSENPATNPGTVDDNTWRVYDHRFEGQIHINKRDLNLNNAVKDATDPYDDDYGIANGDGSLEGATYGLFAAENIEHPDGKTGLVFGQNELVSVATTDRDGNASFMVITEAPGSTYDYTNGKIVAGTRDVKNLYYGYSNDDYTEDGKYEREYDDNLHNNGNYWIGRPLLVGKYYIKELTRSEGYEVSIEGRAELFTNLGEDYNAGVPSAGEAYANVTGPFSTDYTPSMTTTGTPDHNNPAANELTFYVQSYKTDGDYDLVMKKLPAGSKLYRVDLKYMTAGTREEPTGAPAEWVNKLDEHGNPIPAVAGEGTHIKYDGAGNPITITTTLDAYDNKISDVSNINYAAASTAMTEAIAAKMDSDFTAGEVATILTEEIDLISINWKSFVKAKVERALNRAGLSVPKDSGKLSSYTNPVYDSGDYDNKKGGHPVRTLSITKTDCTVGDLILSVISFYEDHPYYSFAGIDEITKTGDSYKVTVYTGNMYNKSAHVEYGGDEAVIETILVSNITSSAGNDNYRYVEAVYTDDGHAFNGDTAVGEYKNLVKTSLYAADLTPAVTAEYSGGSYVLHDKTVDAYQYYPAGTTPVYDATGAIVYEKEYRIPTHTVPYEDWVYRYHLISTKADDAEQWVVNVPSSYTDEFGDSHNDVSAPLDATYMVTVPGDPADLTHTITAADLEKIPASYGLHVGDKPGLAFFYIYIGATVKADPDYTGTEAALAGTFIKTVTLDNVDESEVITQTYADIEERPIRQKLKIRKEIDTMATTKSVWYCANCGCENSDGLGNCQHCSRARTSEPTQTIDYVNDTYGAVHNDNIQNDGGVITTVKDWLSKLLGLEIANERPTDISGFRFKAYLKSNLERLYRTEDGSIEWLDRNGNTLTPAYVDTNGDGLNDTFTWTSSAGTIDFPEDDIEVGSDRSANVQKIYTKVEHKTDSRTVSDRANNVWDLYKNPTAAGGSDVTVTEGGTYTTSERGIGGKGEAVTTNDSLYSYFGKNTDVKTTPYLVDTANTGYTRILETKIAEVEDGTTTRNVEVYNYEKFFDAIWAANTDKWDSDNSSSMSNYPGQHWMQTYYAEYQKDDTTTQFKPFAFIRELVYGNRDDYVKNPTEFNGAYTETKMSTSGIAHANAQASDAVRAFATKYYLSDEAAKLMKNNGLGENVPKDGTIGYDEEIYDKALNEAIAKAYNYLKPFYVYDLDTIYSVEWDETGTGGADLDKTTLSADKAATDEHYNLSAYLPYGTYIVVEQRPEIITTAVNDLMNRSYKTEKPKEHMIPVLYADASSDEYAHNYETHYVYDAAATVETLSKAPENGGYLIRWNEEWSQNDAGGTQKHVIRAHSNNGDFEVYKWGLDTDHLTGSIKDSASATYAYKGMAIEQGQYDPLKDYYSTSHFGPRTADSKTAIGTELGGNTLGGSAYPLESYPGNTSTTNNGKKYDLNELRDNYNYAAISEDAGLARDVIRYDAAKTDNNPEGQKLYDNVKSLTGNLTSYDGVYAQMLVPWSITRPADDYTYDKDAYTGYSDVPVDNSLYSALLTIYKTDSETGERIIHDDAIFGVYAASRYTDFSEILYDAGKLSGTEQTKFLEQFKPGDCKFYLEDTWIEGSREFLMGMKAREIEPILTGSGDYTYSEYNTDSPLCKGKVSKGTPVCLESEQIKLTDEFGNRYGQMRVYTTKDDEILDTADGVSKHYALQNTGAFTTPQPLGSGVYVLVELKAPAGYVRTNPLPYELYWDKTETYVFGDMFNKATLNRETFNLIKEVPYE